MIFRRVQKSISTPVSPYGLSQLRGRIRQSFLVRVSRLFASSRPYPHYSSTHGESPLKSRARKPPLDLPIFGSAPAAVFTCGVHVQRDCSAGLPPSPSASHRLHSKAPRLSSDQFFSLCPGLRTAAHYHRHHSSINLCPYPFAKPWTRLLSPTPRRSLHLLAARIQRKAWSALLRLCWFRLFPLE